MSDASPYGHDHTLLDKLAEWVSACDPFSSQDDIPITGEMRMALVEATRELNKAIRELIPTPVNNHDLWSKAYSVRMNIRELSVQFIVDEYTDSNTDEPCDVEWNVTGLLMLVDPEYRRPDDVRPAYVGYLIDDGPPDDQD